MVKAKKGNCMILGLSEENIQRLKQGQPIKFNMQDLGMGDIDVLIFYGKDEQAIFQEMKESIHPFKTTIIHPKGSKEN